MAGSPASAAGRSGMRRIGCSALAALIVIAAAAPATLAAPTAETVRLVLTEYRFAPDHLSFEHGHSYRLLLENRGKETHEFTAPDFFRAIRLDDRTMLVGGEAVIQPGESKVLSFEAVQPGRFALRCSDHDWAGMTGEIVIR